MPKVRVLTWNVCGDKQARADLAMRVIKSDQPDILFFQEARKTKPTLSNLYAALSASKEYGFLFCDEYANALINYGKDRFAPDTTGKTYYCFYKKETIDPKGAKLTLVDYIPFLSKSGKDPDANLLTTRRPAAIEMKWKKTKDTILFFTWHAPLSGAGGAVFNPQAHSFFGAVADRLVAGKIGIIAGDMNATAKQIARSYSDAFEAAGHHLSHILTNKTIAASAWYDDVMSDVHYLMLADITW